MSYLVENFDLLQWKLTLPVSEKGYFDNGDSSSVEILPYGDQSFDVLTLEEGFTDDDFFYVSDDGALVFQTPLLGGTTTANAKYLRSEFRELYDWTPGDSTGKANWHNEGWHHLHARLRVDEYYAGSPQTVVGQIHAKNSHKALVKILWDGVDKPVRAIINEDPVKGNPFSLTFETVGLKEFSYDIWLHDDTLTISVNDTTHELTFGEGRMSDKWDDHVYYFKVGNYAQANKSSGGIFEVRFYELNIEHADAPLGPEEESESSAPQVDLDITRPESNVNQTSNDAMAPGLPNVGQEDESSGQMDDLIPEAPPAELLFVAGDDHLSAADQILVTALEDRGYAVAVMDDHDAEREDAEDKDLVLISKSVASMVVGDTFATIDAPLLTWKSELYDDLGMTGSHRDVDFGTVSDQSKITIHQPTHALAAHLSGTVEIYGAEKKVAWGLAGADAIQVASLSGHPNHSALFAYEAGASLVNGQVAAEKRVGLFLDHTSSVTDDALAVFNASVDWAIAPPGPDEILFVAGSDDPGAADQILVDRLEDQGYAVTVMDDHGVEIADAVGKALVLISKSVSSTVLQDTLAGVDTPLVTWKSGLYDDLGFTGVQSGFDFGLTNNQSTIVIQNSQHELAAGLSGTVSVYSGEKKVAWGDVSGDAIQIASVSGQPDQSALFAYEAGANLANGSSAAHRRVGLFLDNTTRVTDDGLTLFDAAVDWAIA